MRVPRVRCRQITEADLDGIEVLLRRGFSERYLAPQSLQRLTDHPTPPGLPRYGYMLETEGIPVGVLLLICSRVGDAATGKIRVNVSSWYVEPVFRNYATLLVKQALRHENVTFINISPVPSTLPIIEAQGYVRYCSGGFTAVPALAGPLRGGRVAPIAADIAPGDDLPRYEIDLLLIHQAYGCISLICEGDDGRHPFVFLRRRPRRRPPGAYLIYCRSIDEFVRFAGPLGRHLARRGIPTVEIDADERMRGLIGRFHKTTPKYFKGPDRPRLGDTAYSEKVVFGL